MCCQGKAFLPAKPNSIMKVAVCVDQSNASKEAVKKATEFAELVDGSIELVHSIKPNVRSKEDKLVKEPDTEAEERGRDILSNTVDVVREINKNIVVSTVLLSSEQDDSVENILDHLNHNNFDYVYIGHRSLDEKHEKMYGSFAKRIISMCEIPVTVVPYTNGVNGH